MLYTRQEQMARPPIDGIKLHRAIPTEKGLEGLELCKGIMENLFSETSDGSSEPHSGYQPKSSLLNKHEILRIFLAIKVIFDAVQVVENPSRSDDFLSRASIYNSYYIICQKLSQKYRTCSNSIDLQFDIILSQSRFGRVFKLNFPDLNANRLGRRGNSKYCYREITWNKLLIDEGIKTLAEGNLSDIKNCFKRTQRDRKESGFNNLEPVIRVNVEHNLGLKLNQAQLIKPAERKPLYSFVDLYNKFPGSCCSLRIWKIICGKLPMQSQWSIETMNKSLEALKHYGIDFAPSLNHLQSQGLSPESLNWFLDDALQKVQILMEAYASEDAYLHLYLVVTLLISPVVFASEHELKTDCKPKLFTYLSIFVERLEADFFKMSLLHQNNIMGFAKIIRKMISCIKVLSSSLPTSLAKRTARALGYDHQISKDPVMVKVMEKMSVEIIQRAVVTACNALDWEFVDESLRTNLEYRYNFISRMTASYSDFSNKVVLCSEISESAIGDFGHSSYELPLQIFSESSRLFHEVFMKDPFVLQLPIKLIELMVNSAINEFQIAAFHNFRGFDPEISKEFFKVWWIYSTAVQGHMSVFCEVVALSMRVS